MERFVNVDAVREEMASPHSSGRMTPGELGEALARLVWESFSDFITDPEVQSLLSLLEVPMEEGVPHERAAEELLILQLWTHTRAVQLSFLGRLPEDRIERVLDHLHKAVFEDLAEQGTPRAQLPVFEQRVAARYSEYALAADHSDARVGEAVLGHVLPEGGELPPAAAVAFTRWTVEEASPLRDFLEGVKLVEG